MKCVSALAAMTVIVLGTPAIALASTLGPGPGPGPGGPGQVRIVCPAPPGQHIRPRPVRVKRHGVRVKRHGVRPRGRLVGPFPRGCPPRALIFDMAPGSSTLTEVSGPVLAPPEEFSYHGQLYTIMSVNPGADSFTVFRDGVLFVNHGPAITRAKGIMVCPPRPVRQKCILA
ncbi:MAG: hypothetical protein ACRDOA_06285 [Streptosporangiaceae bacterium]